uniref:Uncharacterized protein n=1 Tax=Tanacetum cinerariifolium TaxID=118510 RepID=A0A6L2J876_TANCI|nr:hypothetical protein [Tanacetum cinerariifolium]
MTTGLGVSVSTAIGFLEGCDPLALVDGFTPVENNIGLLETRFDEEAILVFVFPQDVTGSVNLTLLALFIGVTATNLPLEPLMLGQVLMIDCLGIAETDKVNHIVEIAIVKLVVEIKSFGVSDNELDKETGSSDGL